MLPCRIRDYRILYIQKNENALLAFNKMFLKYIHTLPMLPLHTQIIFINFSIEWYDLKVQFQEVLLNFFYHESVSPSFWQFQTSF